MRYFRIAIIAPMDISDDNNTWHCFEQLRLSGHAVEIVDPRVFPSILHSDGSLNREALAPFFARFQPDYVSLGKESAQDILHALARSNISGFEKRIRRFVVFGYVGPGNFGDELIFSLICRELNRRWPGAHICLIGHNPQTTLLQHGVVSITTEMKLQADIMISGADALIFMAGIMFDDPFESWTAGPIDPFLNPRSEIGGQTAFTLMASSRNVPVFFLGIGAGPLSNPDAQRLVRLESSVGARYLPRDPETEQLLLNAGVPKTAIERKADLAFLIDPTLSDGAALDYLQTCNIAVNSYIAVSLRSHRTVPSGFEKNVATALDKSIETLMASVLFVDLAPEDHEIHSAVLQKMKRQDAAHIISQTNDLRFIIDLLAKAKCVLAMRLHCSIVANACNTPSIGLDYNEKVNAYYRYSGRESFLLPMDSPADRIVSALSQLANSNSSSNQLLQLSSTFHDLAIQAFDRLGQTIEPRTPQQEIRRIYPRSISLEEISLRNAETRIIEVCEKLSKAEADLFQQTSLLEEMKASTSWKVGRAVTALPRFLKYSLYKIQKRLKR